MSGFGVFWKCLFSLFERGQYHKQHAFTLHFLVYKHTSFYNLFQGSYLCVIPVYVQLWANDQLSIALQKGQVFHGFQEGPLLFPPTYKYDVGTDNYDTSSKVLIFAQCSLNLVI